MAWATDIRTDVVTRLAAASTSAAGRIEDTRLRPIVTSGMNGAVAVDTCPRIVLSTRRMRREPRGSRAMIYRQTLELVIACYAAGDATTPADVLAAAETLDEEVFDALRDDGEWLASFSDVPKQLGSGDSAVEIIGTQAVAVVSQVWELTVETARPQPRGDALETVVATMLTTPQPVVATRNDGLDA